MALYTTLKVIEEGKDLQIDVSGEKVQGLHACLCGQPSLPVAAH